MKIRNYVIAAVAAFGVATGSQAANVALTTDGASFQFASSSIDLAQGSSLTTMQKDPISLPPTPWLSNGDTRYIFGTSDPDQAYLINLGKSYDLNAFSASFASADRAIGTLTIFTSNDGEFYTPYVGTLTSTSTNGVTRFSVSGATTAARYVDYGFGPASTQYGDGGSAVINVTADTPGAVPEPATWAMMMLGFGMIGFGLRGRSKVSTTVRFA